MQVDPVKPTLQPTGTKRLKLKCDVLLSSFAFGFNLRRYIKGMKRKEKKKKGGGGEAGSYTRPLFSST